MTERPDIGDRGDDAPDDPQDRFTTSRERESAGDPARGGGFNLEHLQAVHSRYSPVWTLRPESCGQSMNCRPPTKMGWW